MSRRSSEQGWSSCLGSIPIAVPISSGVAVAVPDSGYIVCVYDFEQNSHTEGGVDKIYF